MITIHNGNNRPSSIVGFRPERLLPESEKTEQWAKETADWCIAQCSFPTSSKEEDYYDIFNGERNNSQFDYLTKTFGIDFPAKIKHIPLMRPRFNRLIGEEQERGISFDLISIGEDAVSEKKDHVRTFILKRLVQLQRGEITEEEFLADEKYLKRKFRTNKEIAIHKALKQLVLQDRLHEAFSQAWIDKIVTGREYGRVLVNRIGEDPEFEVIPPTEIQWARNEKRWVSECDWAVRWKRMTSTEILDAYGERLSDKDKEELVRFRDIYGKSSLKMRDLSDLNTLVEDGLDISDFESWENDLFDIYEVEYKSIRKVPVLVNENSFDPENPHIHILKEEELETLPGKKKKNVTYRYFEDLWRVTRIGPDIYPRVGKYKYAERDHRRPSRVKLSFEGPTFNGNVKPYSLVGTTYDLQMLYDIMHFHKENLIAMSGTKGMVMDLPKLPDFGYGFDTQQGMMENIKMYLYYRKMGTAFVDSSREENDGRFNQLSTYDDTLGPGLGVILNVITHIEEIAGDLIGVNRQRLGDIQPREGKANAQEAIAQSSLSIEPLFNEHDDFKDRILEKLVYAANIAWKNGKNGVYIDDSYEQHFFAVEPNLPMSNYKIYINNRFPQTRTLEELKAVSQLYAREGLIPFETAIDILTTTSLQEVQQTLKDQIADRQNQMQQQQAQVEQMQMQLEAAQNEIKRAEVEGKLAKMQAEIQTMGEEIRLKQQELNNDLDIENKKLELEGKRIDLEALQLQIASRQNETKNNTEVRNK